MRKKNAEKLGSIIEQVLKENQLTDRLYQHRVINSWEEVLGKNISEHTTNLYFNDKRLHVTISSSVLRHELFLMRHKIKDKLNQHVGKPVIIDIRLH